MKFPNIITEDCATNPATSSDCTTDARCSDPAFAAANPLICASSQSIELRPGFEIICNSAALQFTVWLRSGDGQIQITNGLSFSSSDSSILTVDATTGQATAIGAGIASVTVVWQGMAASAQITVIDGETDNCCSGIEVDMAIVEDNSQSMSQTFSTTGTFIKTKGQLAREFAELIRTTGDYVKDKLSVTWFNETAATPGPLGSSNTDLFAALQSFPTFVLDKKTSLPSGFNEALSALGFDGSQSSPGNGSSLQRVIFLISDGASRPALSDAQVSSLVADADAFKAAGGIIFCIGIRAAGDGFIMLQRLATSGFFINVIGSQVQNQTTVNQWILDLICSFCGGDRTDDYYSCVAPEIGPQVPDPQPLPDIESGDTGGPGDGGGPKLPKPVFTPASGTSATDFTVALSVPNHPNAWIRFTLKEDGTGWPLDPSFNFPSDPNTGLDYDGQNVPVTVLGVAEPWYSAYLKAVARETGYTDSDVASVKYPSGLSNNTDAMVINDATGTSVDDYGKATTYPSVKYVTGVTGHITKVTATLTGFAHTWPSDVRVLLVSPSGTAVLLMAGCGGSFAVSGINLTFDDTGIALPGTILTTGTYKPTNLTQLTNPPFPGPAPDGPFDAVLSGFNGEDPNGGWELYVVDSAPVNSGSIASGWDITISTA